MSKSIKGATIALLLLSSPALAEEECMLDLAALEPVFDASRPGVKIAQLPQLDKEQRLLTEEIVFGPGIHVAYGVGGCVHFGYSLKYHHVTGVSQKAPPEETIKKAKELLLATPFLPSFDVKLGDHSTLLKALDEALKHPPKPENNTMLLDCGDATCEIHVPADGEIKIGYDFPL